jgi:hypothetical protein
MFRGILQWILFGIFILYITAKVKCRNLWNATIGAWLRRPRIAAIGGRHYVLSFYIGDTLCKIIVKRRGPPDFYAATTGESVETTDISDAVTPFFAVQEIAPTPEHVGFETITFWDFDDNPTTVAGDSIITF